MSVSSHVLFSSKSKLDRKSVTGSGQLQCMMGGGHHYWSLEAIKSGYVAIIWPWHVYGINKTRPREHAMSWGAHNPNLLKTYVAQKCKIDIKSGHNFAHATTAELLWHVQNCDLIKLPEIKLKQNAGSQDLDYELTNYLWNGSQVIPVEGNSGILHTKNCDEMKYLCYTNEIFILLCGWCGHHNTNKISTLFK